MLRKLLAAALVGAVAKFVVEKMKGSSAEADLWAEATDSVEANR